MADQQQPHQPEPEDLWCHDEPTFTPRYPEPVMTMEIRDEPVVQQEIEVIDIASSEEEDDDDDAATIIISDSDEEAANEPQVEVVANQVEQGD